jgi:hypothetical protein
VLAIELPAGRYRAEWVDTKSGAIARREAFDHKGGARKLAATNHKDDVALRIEAIGVK